MRLVVALALVASAGLATIASCTSFGEEPGGVLPSPEGGSLESGVVEGGAISDASDAGALVCPSGAFCDDFERDEVVKPDWIESATGGPPLAIDPTVSVSPTRSLLLTLGAGGGITKRALQFKFDPTKRQFDVSFSMRIDALPAEDAELALVAFQPGHFVFLLAGAAAGIRLVEQDRSDGGSGFLGSTVGRPPLDTFVRYRLVVDLDKKKAEVTTDVDELKAKLDLKFGNKEPALFLLGNAYAPDEPVASHAWYDDVVIVR